MGADAYEHAYEFLRELVGRGARIVVEHVFLGDEDRQVVEQRALVVLDQDLDRPPGNGVAGVRLLHGELDGVLDAQAERSQVPGQRVHYADLDDFLGGRIVWPVICSGAARGQGARPNQWAYLNNPFGFQFFVGKNSNLPYTDGGLREQGTATLQVHMRRPPATAADVLFYPVKLYHSDLDKIAVVRYKADGTPA